MSDLTNKMVMEVQETQDEFIFSTLNNYIQTTYRITVKKEELALAVQLIRMYRLYGSSIDQRLETATQNAAELDAAYRRGFQDGRKEEHDRIMEILDERR